MPKVISFSKRGGFAKTRQFIEHAQELEFASIMHKYGQKGVELLARATPVRTGKTQASWSYEIALDRKGRPYLDFYNSNTIRHTSIVKLIVYGHATKQGLWIEPNDFITPVIQPLFKELAKELWREVRKR